MLGGAFIAYIAMTSMSSLGGREVEKGEGGMAPEHSYARLNNRGSQCDAW